MAPKRYGLTSSPVSPWRRGHGYLLLISTDQAHKSRVEMSDFLILTPKIFTRNEPLVKVTSPLQVPSKHPSHLYSDLILDFKSVITIELCYGSAASARQPSLPLFATVRRWIHQGRIDKISSINSLIHSQLVWILLFNIQPFESRIENWF